MLQGLNIQQTGPPTGKPFNDSGKHLSDPDAAEPNSAVERPVGLTSFVDAEDTLVDVSHATTNETTRQLTAIDTEADSIDRVLNRPTFMNNIAWSTTDTIGTVLSAYNLPEAIFNFSSIKTCKVQYNQFMNCDVVFRIEASPIQFQAGRLWLCFEPYRDQRGARAQYGFPSSFTVLPGVGYDPAKPAPVELRVPFSSILGAWDLPIGQYGSGTILVYVLSPLNSGTSTTSVTLSVQAWLENTRVRVPVQTGAVGGPAFHAQEFPFGEPMHFQSKADNLANTHRFSRTAERISSIASFLGSFPLLASVAQPVAAFSGSVAKLAAYFGFSKPPDVSAPTKIVSHNRAAWPNADGPLPLVKLSLTSDNAVNQKGRYFPNPVDEMDIKYIVSNMSMLNAWSWSTTDAVGKLITVIPVHPGVAAAVSGPGTYTFKTYAPTPLAYVSSMFKYWAGAIKIRLEAVSTPFHAGRLMVAYIPDFDPFQAYTIGEVGNNYSVLWDITDSSHLEFEVPYLGNTPYLDCFMDDQAYTTLKNGETAGLQVRDRIRKVQNGSIVVYVLNQLVAPTTTSTTISVLNWIGGGEDITFAEPVMGMYKPVDGGSRIDYTSKWYDGTTMTESPYPVPPTVLSTIDEEDDLEWEYQSDAPPDSRMVTTPSSSSAPVKLAPVGTDTNLMATTQRQCSAQFIPMKRIDPQDRARLAMGEVVTNLRTLTRRLTPAYIMYPQNVTTAGAWTAAAVPPTNLNVLTLDPDYFGTGDGQDDQTLYGKQIAPARVGNVNWLTELESSLSYVGRMYAFARGSRVFGIQSNASNVINASKFQTIPDETDNKFDQGTFDVRLSTIIDEDSPPRQPYFRPEDNLLGYNYANVSSATLSATNFSYGFNSALSGNFAVQKAGEAGCGLVFQVPPTSKYPFKLITTPYNTEANYILNNKYSAPRSRRFVEIRYRPFSSALSGGTSTYTPKIWPFPTTIMESAADDFSFGGLVPPPLITKVSKGVVFPNYSTGAKISL